MRSFKKKEEKNRLDEVSSSQKYNVSYLRDFPYESRIQLSAAHRIKKKNRVCKCALDTEKNKF